MTSLLRFAATSVTTQYSRLAPGRPSATGVAATLFAHAVAFSAVGHCNYFLATPSRPVWIVAELLLVLLMWPVLRPLTEAIAGTLRTAGRIAPAIPAVFGAFVAVWWPDALADTLSAFSHSDRAWLGWVLLLAHAGVAGGVAAAVLAAVIATDPEPVEPLQPRANGGWGPVVVIGGFLAAACGFAAWYVSRENAVYYVDFMFYWCQSADWAELCLRSPKDGWALFQATVKHPGYTLVPAVVPGAVMAVIGDHRLVFVLTVTTVYLTGTAAAAVGFVRRFAPTASPTLASAFPVAGLLTMPLAWVPVVRGFPDVGGVALAVLSLTLYLGRPRGELRWPHLLGTAAVLAGMALFRRWYNFWAVAFVLLMFVDAAIGAVGPLVRGRWRDVWRQVRPAGVVLALFGGFLLAAAWPMVANTAGTSYSDAFAAYRTPLPAAARAIAVGKFIGLGYFVAAAAGLVYLLAFAPGARRVTAFASAMVPIMTVHFLSVQDFNAHHMYLLLPAVLLLPTLALARVSALLPRACGWVGVAGVLVVGTAGLIPVVDAKANELAMAMWPYGPEARCAPFTRSDLPEFRRMLAFVNAETARTGQGFYALSSSDDLHSSMFTSAERSLREPFPAARHQQPTNEVDRVNGFPTGLFRAGLVLVGDPVQTHLRPEEQQIVVVPQRFIVTGTGIGRAFDELPERFALQHGVTVRAFRRARPIEQADFDAFRDELRRAHPTRPFVFEPGVPVDTLLAVPAAGPGAAPR